MPINPSPAVQRAGQVLWHLAEHPSETHTVAQLSRVLDIPRATCDSILQALTIQGFVNRREVGYELGASCLALASAAQAANAVLSVANRHGDQLARDLGASVVISTVIADQARAVAVFDRAPSTVYRGRIGLAVPLVPPFGVVFVAWNSEASENWLLKGGETDTADAERSRAALRFAQRNGYTYSVLVAPGREFGQVMEDLAIAPDYEPSRRTRDQLTDELRHSEYLATEIERDAEVQLLQISAPVFDANGAVAASIMVLGSMRPMRGEDVEALGRQVMEAADRATTSARELRLGGPAVGY
jgi:DNA-binding IclR family transcriptional regulator